MKKNKVLVIQPCIPEYRTSLYENITQIGDVDLYVKASKTDVDGLSSISLIDKNFKADLSLSEHYLFKKKLIVQKGLKLNELKKFDVVVITGNPRYINNYVYILYCRILGIKIIWWGQGWSANSSKLSYTIRMAISRIANGFIFYTDNEREISKKNIFYNKNSTALNNGLDLVKIDSAIKKNASKICKGVSEILNLVFIGRVNNKSNILFLLESLLRIDFQIKLTVIGDGELLKQAQEFCDKNKLINVKFEGAIYNEDSLAKILLVQDCFIYPGAVGLSLIHAYLYSLPAIVHSNYREHMPEVIAFDDNKNGFCFKKDSIDSLLNILNQTYKLKVKGELITYGKRGREIAEHNYTTQSMAHRFSRFIKLGNDFEN